MGWPLLSILRSRPLDLKSIPTKQRTTQTLDWLTLGVESKCFHVFKPTSVDDSRLLVDIPSNYPELISSVEPGGVQPEMGGQAGELSG